MPYVDGFIVPVPATKLFQYKRVSRKCGKIWRGYGALEFRECVGEDLRPKMGALFPRTVRLKPSETVVFSWIVFKSRAHRDSVNKKVMKDPRMLKIMEEAPMPFDPKRMAYGGFRVIVDL